MIKIEYYCDCCKKQVAREGKLTSIKISLGSSNGVTNGVTSKEVCIDCWKLYTDRMAEVAKEFFED